MDAKRLWYSFCSLFFRNGPKRANFYRKHHVFGALGEHCQIHPRMIPLYPELLFFHDNVMISRGVDFVTHDGIHRVLNRLPEEKRDGYKFKEHIGCVEVLDNVMIGSNCTVLYGTRIGPNVIIASGSVITKDCEPNSVYAGVPARKIGTLDDYIKKRIEREKSGEYVTTTHNQNLTEQEIEAAEVQFLRSHGDTERKRLRN